MENRSAEDRRFDAPNEQFDRLRRGKQGEPRPDASPSATVPLIGLRPLLHTMMTPPGSAGRASRPAKDPEAWANEKSSKFCTMVGPSSVPWGGDAVDLVKRLACNSNKQLCQLVVHEDRETQVNTEWYVG